MVFLWIEDSGSQATDSNGGAETGRKMMAIAEALLATDSNGGAETASETAATVPSTSAKPNSSETSPPDRLAEVHQTLTALQGLFEEHISNNQRQKEQFDALYKEQFDALYEEMRGYKDNSLLEAFVEPVIRYLLPIYDSFVSLKSDLSRILEDQEEARSGELTQFQQDLEHTRSQLLEALHLLDVRPYPDPPESRRKLDNERHQTIAVVEVDTAEKDFEIKTYHRTGFLWRDKVYRPEDVTIYRYNPPKTEEGEETNG